MSEKRSTQTTTTFDWRAERLKFALIAEWLNMTKAQPVWSFWFFPWEDARAKEPTNAQ